MLGRVYTTTMLYSLLYRDKLFSDGELMNIDSTSLPDMTCESNHLFIYFRSLTFQYDGIVSDSSPQPPLQIPPLALPKSRLGQDVRLFFEREIFVIYLTTEHVFKRRELRSHITKSHVVLFISYTYTFE
jgi:hypothetical protein